MDEFEVFANLAPTPAMIIASHEKTFTWRLCFCELIDNAFDAKADVVRIEMRNRTMKFVDNGVGTDNPAIMLSQGSRKQHSGVTLGRYGVGASDAFMWLYGVTTITSSDGHATRQVQVRWSDVAAMNEWPQIRITQGPEMRGIESGKLFEKTGTCIEITGHTRNNPPYDGLIKDIGFTYWPALEEQRRKITFYQGKKAIPVVPFKPPRFKQGEFRTVEFQINGKRVTATGGNVMDHAENRHPGFNYSYNYRVILDSDERAAGDKSVARFFCHVSLSPEWILSRNKDTIGGSASEQDELFGKLNEAFGDLIEKSSNRELRLALSDIEGWIEDSLQDKSDVAQKRDPGETEGSHPKSDTPRTRQRAASKTKPGDKRLKTKRTTISIDVIDGDPELVGRVSVHGNQIAVRLHRQYPPVSEAMLDPEKRDIGQWALALAAHAQSLRSPVLPAMASPETEEYIRVYSQAILLNYKPIRRLAAVSSARAR